MSTTIDERVVEMKFNNKDFEKNIATSMSTLEKFKQKLNFSGAVKGIDEINKAAGKFSLDGLESAADSVELKFSAMSVAAIAAINKIVSSAIDAGANLVKSLSVDNIAAGWEKFGEKTTSVGTLISQGYKLEQVNEQLERLNWFTDETSYNFTDMVSNIAKFTATGQELEPSVTAMMGIANWAALSGQNATKASQAMYQLSQAMGKGALKLDDFKSIQNVSMDTAEFRQKCLDAAEALGELKKIGEDTYETLNGHEFTKTQFTEYLTEDAWLSSEVMMEVFTEYSAAVDQIMEYAEEKGITASQAIEELGEELDAFGLKAFKSAQEARTWSDVIDSVKDAVSTGWMQTFELIIGDYEEAKTLYTQMANDLYDIFNGGAEGRNDRLFEGLSSGWKKFLSQGISDSEAFKKEVISVAKSMGVPVEAAIEASGSFEQSLYQGWMTADILTTSVGNLADKLADLSEEELHNEGYTLKQRRRLLELNDALKDGSISAEDFAQSMARVSGRDNLVESLWNLRDALFLVDEESEKSIGFVAVFKEALSDVFPEMTGEQIYNLTVKIREFTQSLIPGEETATNLGNTLRGLFSIFDLIGQGASAVIRSIASLSGVFRDSTGGVLKLTGGLGEMIFNLAQSTKESDLFYNKIQSVVNGLRTAYEAVRDFYNGVENNPIESFLKDTFGEERYNRAAEAMATILEKLGNAFDFVVGKARSFFGAFDGSDQVVGVFSSMYDFLAPIAGWILDRIIDGLEAVATFDYKGAYRNLKEELSGIINVFQSIKEFVEGARDAVSAFFDRFEGKSVSELIGEMADNFKMLKESLNASGNTNFLETFSEFAEQHLPTVVRLLNGLKEGTVGFLEQLTPGKILVFAFGTTLVSLIVKIADAVGGFKSLLEGITGFFEALAARIKPSPITQIAIAIGVLAAALVALSLVKPEGLKQATISLLEVAGALAVLLGVVALISASKKIDSAKIESLSRSLLLLSAAMLALSVGVTVLSAANLDGLGWKFLILVGAITVMVGATAFLSKVAPELSKNGVTLLMFALSIATVAKSLEILSRMDVGGLVKSFGALSMIVGLMVVLSASAGKVKFGGAAGITVLILDLLLMVKVMERLVEVDPADIIEALPNFIILLSLFAALMLTSKLAGDKTIKAGVGLAAMSASILILSEAIKRIGELDPAVAKQGIKVVAILEALFTGIMLLSSLCLGGKGALNSGGGFVLMSGAILVLGLAIKYIGALPLQDVVKGTAVVLLLGGLFALMMKASGSAKGATGAIISMTVALGVMVAAVMLLTLVPFGEAIKSAAVLGGIMLAFAWAIKLMGKVDWKSALTNCIMMGVMIAEIGVAFVLLQGLDMANTLQLALSLSAVVLAFSGAIAILSNFANNTKNGTNGIKMFTLFFADVVLLVGILGAFATSPEFGTFMSNGVDTLVLIETIIPVLYAFAGLAAVLGLVGKLGLKSEAVGVVGFDAIFVSVIYIIQKFGEMGNVWYTLNGVVMLALIGEIIPVLLGFALLAAILGVVGKFAGVKGLIGVGIFDAVIISVAAIVTGLGALTRINGFTDLVNDGIPIFTKLGEVIGAFFGNVVGGFIGGIGEGVTSALPKMADNLTDFINRLQPFLEGAKKIDSSVTDGVKNLALAMLAFTAADLLDQFSKFIGGGLDLGKFGSQLNEFAPALAEFADTIAGHDFSSIEQAASGAKALADFVSELPREDGILQSIIGNPGSLDKFAQGIQKLGPALAIFQTTLMAAGGIDEELVTSAANAGKALAELNKSLPRSGGKLQEFIGEQNMEKFGSDIQAFARAIVGYDETLKAHGELDNTLITSSVNAGKALSELNNSLPRSGGTLQEFLGEKSMEGFGEGLVAFAKAIVQYDAILKAHGSIDDSLVESSTNAGMALAALNNAIPSSGGVAQFFTGEKDFGAFADNLKAFGEAFSSYYESIKSIKWPMITKSVAATEDIVNIANMLKPNSGISTWWSSSNIETFGKQLDDFGAYLQSYASYVGTITWSDVQTSINYIYKIIDMTAAMAGLDSTACENFNLSLQYLANSGIKGFTTAFADAESEFQNAGQLLLDSVKTPISDGVESIGNLGRSIVQSFVDGAESVRTQSLVPFGKRIIDTLLSSISTRDREVNNAGIDTMTQFREGMLSMESQVRSAASALASAVVGQMKEKLGYGGNSEFYSMGEYVAQGLANGMTSSSSMTRVANAASTLARQASRTAGSTLQVASPSKVFKLIGIYVAQGFAQGITEGSDQAVAATEGMVGDAVSVIQSGQNTTQAGYNTAEGLASGLAAGTPDVTSASQSIRNTVTGEIDDGVVTVKQIGKDTSDAYADGMTDRKPIVKDAANEVTEDAAEVMEESITTFRDIGERVARAFADGLLAGKDPVAAAAQQLADTAVDTMSTVSTSVSDSLGDAMSDIPDTVTTNVSEALSQVEEAGQIVFEPWIPFEEQEIRDGLRVKVDSLDYSSGIPLNPEVLWSDFGDGIDARYSSIVAEAVEEAWSRYDTVRNAHDEYDAREAEGTLGEWGNTPAMDRMADRFGQAVSRAVQGGVTEAGIGRAVANALNGVTVTMDGRRVGQIAASQINRYSRTHGESALLT